jgi:hypothetical protein
MQTYNSFGELKDGFMLPKKAFHAGNDLLINPSIVIISSISPGSGGKPVYPLRKGL